MKILAFGIAKDIVGGMEIDFPLKNESSVIELKKALLQQYPQFEKLTSLAIAVNSEYASDDIIIQRNDEVVLIPPVSGG